MFAFAFTKTNVTTLKVLDLPNDHLSSELSLISNCCWNLWLFVSSGVVISLAFWKQINDSHSNASHYEEMQL